MENIKNVDGFLFAIIDEETAKDMLKNCEHFFILHEDGTESLAEDENDINTALNFGEKFGIELGFLKNLEEEFKKGEQNRFRNNDKRDFNQWLDDKINVILE